MLKLAVALVSLALLSEAVIKIPLHKKKVPNEREIEITKLNSKSKELIQGQPDFASVILINDNHFFYYANITIGTPPQEFSLLLDTSYSKLVVPLAPCSFCQYRRSYNPNDSSTYVNDEWDDVLGDYYVRDTFTIGGLAIQGQFIGVTTREFSHYPGMNFDGIMGMRRTTTNTDGILSYNQNLLAKGLIEEDVFSIYLASENTGGDILVLGGVDPNYYTGEITYADGYNGLWIFNMQNATVGHLSLCPGRNPCDAVADTSTYGIAVPETQFDKLMSALNGIYRRNIDDYTIYCEDITDLPPVVLGIGGKDFTIEAKDYIAEHEAVCITKFERTSEYYWKLGGVFLRKYYSVFDMGRNQIGFARAKESSLEAFYKR